MMSYVKSRVARDIRKTSLQQKNLTDGEVNAIAKSLEQIQYEFTNDPNMVEFVPSSDELVLAIADRQNLCPNPSVPEGVAEATPPPLCHSSSMLSKYWIP